MTKKEYIQLIFIFIASLYSGSFLIYLMEGLKFWIILPTAITIAILIVMSFMITLDKTIDIIKDGFKK